MNQPTTVGHIAARLASMTPSATLEVSAQAARLRNEGHDIVDFGAGQPDFDTPVVIKDRAIEALRGGFTKYTPTPGMSPLRKAIATRVTKDQGVPFDSSQIVVSNGAKHSLFNALFCLCDPGDEVICIAPYWTSYPEQVHLVGATPVVLNTEASRGFRLEGNALKETITERTRVLILNSPSNPTGRVYSEEEFATLAEALRAAPQVTVLSDEIYDSLVYSPAVRTSLLRVAPDLANRVVVVGSVSKTFAMTGWRIGWTASAPELSQAMDIFQSHATSCANSFAQKGALAALLADSSITEEMTAEFDKRRLYMVSRLASLPGLHLVEPQGAFYVFPRIRSYFGKRWEEDEIDGSVSFCSTCLRASGVSLVPGAAFGADEHVRLSYAASSDEIEKGLDRFEEFLEKLR